MLKWEIYSNTITPPQSALGFVPSMAAFTPVMPPGGEHRRLEIDAGGHPQQQERAGAPDEGGGDAPCGSLLGRGGHHAHHPRDLWQLPFAAPPVGPSRANPGRQLDLPDAHTLAKAVDAAYTWTFQRSDEAAAGPRAGFRICNNAQKST